jgi:elongation factor G
MGIEPVEDGSGTQVVLAEVPYAEMTDYVIALRASTQGRGRFDFDFVRYEEVPAALTDKIIKEATQDN